MKRFTVGFVKHLYVRGTKVFEAETSEEAAAKADAALHDLVKPLRTTDVRWGDPQYVGGSFALDGTKPVEAPEYVPEKNIRNRLDVPINTVLDCAEIGWPGLKIQCVDQSESEGCRDCCVDSVPGVYL